MSLLRTLLCGFLGAFIAIAGLSAQDVRDTIGPIEKQAQANPITPENPIPRRTFSVPPAYPAEASGINAVGTVSLVATIDETGRVVEIRKAREPLVLTQSTPQNPTAVRLAGEALVRDAAGALRRWTYDPPAKGPLAFTVSFSFKPGAEPATTQSASVPPSGVTNLSTFVSTPGAPGAMQPVRVGGQVKAPTQIKKVQPVYPAEAQAAKVQGIVIMEATIGVDGRVTDARVLRSVPLLDQAAVDAVRQWEYTPTLLNGTAVPIIMTVTVTFNLAPAAPPAPPLN
ncbi:MAG TPA: energy transducer TonB [Vicinamibacterales bacterium]|nr:energy transducer TonB [Vicinamibacterales bacterium]